MLRPAVSRSLSLLSVVGEEPCPLLEKGVDPLALTLMMKAAWNGRRSRMMLRQGCFRKHDSRPPWPVREAPYSQEM
jgi:hypothetical protein